eukprot:6276142-Prymnesium_polylepis.1
MPRFLTLGVLNAGPRVYLSQTAPTAMARSEYYEYTTEDIVNAPPSAAVGSSEPTAAPEMTMAQRFVTLEGVRSPRYMEQLTRLLGSGGRGLGRLQRSKP